MFGIVAHPCHHVRTPQALNAMFAERGTDAVLVPFDVTPDNLASFIPGICRAANLGGIVVTVPHKAAAAPLCDRLTTRASAAGAINCVRREGDGSLTGDLLDGPGFVRGLKAAGHAVAGRRVLLVGAGGAAAAIAMAVAEERPARLALVNRSPGRLSALADRLRAHHPGIDLVVGGAVGAHDLVVNATSLGLREADALPLDPDDLAPGTVVAEVVMQPEVTPLLEAAMARGCHVVAGRSMLEGQLDEMCDFLLAGRA